MATNDIGDELRLRADCQQSKKKRRAEDEEFLLVEVPSFMLFFTFVLYCCVLPTHGAIGSRRFSRSAAYVQRQGRATPAAARGYEPLISGVRRCRHYPAESDARSLWNVALYKLSLSLSPSQCTSYYDTPQFNNIAVHHRAQQRREK